MGNRNTKLRLRKLNSKTLKTLFVGIIALQVGVILATVFSLKGRENSRGDNDSFVPFLPVWVAVFVPYLAAKKKDRKELTEGKYWILIGIALLFLTASVWFLLYVQSK